MSQTLCDWMLWPQTRDWTWLLLRNHSHEYGTCMNENCSCTPRLLSLQWLRIHLLIVFNGQQMVNCVSSQKMLFTYWYIMFLWPIPLCHNKMNLFRPRTLVSTLIIPRLWNRRLAKTIPPLDGSKPWFNATPRCLSIGQITLKVAYVWFFLLAGIFIERIQPGVPFLLAPSTHLFAESQCLQLDYRLMEG